MEVRLKGYPVPVHLAEVVQDDEVAVIGTTNSGKRFVARRDRIAPDLPARHPYRVYLKNGLCLRVIDPEFEKVEEFFLDTIPGPDPEAEGYDPEQADEIVLITANGEEFIPKQYDILSVLSATPEDEAQARGEGNGNVEIEADAAVPAQG